jgi:hypothetical protein
MDIVRLTRGGIPLFPLENEERKEKLPQKRQLRLDPVILDDLLALLPRHRQGSGAN